ncbi:MAG: hypothetical protein G01um10148_820 [Parcubacteria group bacterium Gr01-1014_8]|nr:MAG: hypothetical protein G01um10148_820 [Parcubacteria group bacterium Gr01-1014_8]
MRHVAWANGCPGVSPGFRYNFEVTYAIRVRDVLSTSERRIFSRLSSPRKLQDFLESIPINFEQKGETNHSPENVLKTGEAHCFEAAVFAAAVLAYHGRKPLLMDFATAYDDEDHTVALFRESGLWGAISKTNHAVLRYRDAVYRTPRELALSYFHEYYMWDGRKSLRAFSKPFDVSRYAPEKWITTETSLDWLMDRISKSPYYAMAPEKALKKLRPASPIELRALKLTEWKKKV